MTRRIDPFSPSQRSAVMRQVRSRDTAPELALRKALFALGLRYRLHATALPGKPDIVFPRKRTVVFVHGCFWHGHCCKRGARMPVANAAYWRAKISRNCERDRHVRSALGALGWTVLVSWECYLKYPEKEARKIQIALQQRAQER